jgi:hypothetical protein
MASQTTAQEATQEGEESADQERSDSAEYALPGPHQIDSDHHHQQHHHDAGRANGFQGPHHGHAPLQVSRPSQPGPVHVREAHHHPHHHQQSQGQFTVAAYAMSRYPDLNTVPLPEPLPECRHPILTWAHPVRIPDGMTIEDRATVQSLQGQEMVVGHNNAWTYTYGGDAPANIPRHYIDSRTRPYTQHPRLEMSDNSEEDSHDAGND